MRFDLREWLGVDVNLSNVLLIEFKTLVKRGGYYSVFMNPRTPNNSQYVVLESIT